MNEAESSAELLEPRLEAYAWGIIVVSNGLHLKCQLDAVRAEAQKLEGVDQKKLNDLEELKKSMLQKAFAGELKTKNGGAV